MSTQTVTDIVAYAHCGNPYCPGHAQAEVKAERVETGQTFFENGGDVPGIERSMVDLQFVREKDAVCDCGRRKELSGEPRPQYENLSGFDPQGLLSVPAFDPAKKNTEADAAQAAELAELRAQVDALIAEKKDAA